ncbi:MAG TPA: hypothetical protein VK591_01055 [Xanthobacteraceae bacterium]|nr:hypothetical protein [Xanthobacteraceae bacterium]
MYLGSIRSGVLAALAMAGALGGCGDVGWDTGTLFRKPVDVVGRSNGYTYSDLQESRQGRPVTDSDLVDASGSCPAAAAPGGNAPGPGEGVGLGMTECEVVARAGPPNSVQLGRNPSGDRTAVISYQSGPRPGIYHFERGRLMQMDRVEVAPPPPQAKKKPAKTKKPATGNSAT